MKQDLRGLLRNAGALFREKWRLWLLLALVAAAGVMVLVPRDADWGRQLVVADKRFALFVSFWGDFPRGWLLLIVVLGVLGWVLKQRTWRVVALAALLAGLLAGAQCHSISSLTGRPRPSAAMADRLHGPTLSRTYKSFPSGHTTCAFAVATTLAVSLPVLGVPCLPLAALVGWSRIAGTSHYPSDVWAGMWLGLINGLIIGLAARRFLASSNR
ncbi:MAG: phosphatase PAP2 family protein [Verrucomicrobia bacterium]|nr:phosphatase PAP2 family protein [Verrucomicrobiota bacterium]